MKQFYEIQTDLRNWYKRKKQEAYASDWRPHGAKVGDKVRLHVMFGDYECDELYDMLDGEEVGVEFKVKNRAIGVITRLGQNCMVTATFPATVFYYDIVSGKLVKKDKNDSETIEAELVLPSEVRGYHKKEWVFFEVVRTKPKKAKQTKQLELF